tara:strand:+ start:438 stop:581 length:144 start_codon:yes stop_codon:yes gene_type:complete
MRLTKQFVEDMIRKHEQREEEIKEMLVRHLEQSKFLTTVLEGFKEQK